MSQLRDQVMRNTGLLDELHREFLAFSSKYEKSHEELIHRLHGLEMLASLGKGAWWGLAVIAGLVGWIMANFVHTHP